MTRITTLPQLQALQENTMIYAVVVFLVAILIAFLISLMIPYKGGIDKSYIKRRVAYIIVGIVACLAFYLYNDIYVKGFIQIYKIIDRYVEQARCGQKHTTSTTVKGDEYDTPHKMKVKNCMIISTDP